jgi:PAS domain S-box-containing protein
MFLYDGASLRIVVSNMAARSRYGYSSMEFRSLTIRDLHPCGAAPASVSAIPGAHDKESGSLWTHVTKSGKLFSIELRLVPFVHRRHNLCLMSAVDASAWSEARLNLVRSEEIHRSLVEECPFGTYRFNVATALYEQANPALLHLLGYSLEDFCSSPRPHFHCNAADRQRYLSELQASGRVRDFETSFRKKDGSILRVSISGYLCTNAENGHQYVQTYVRDITRQRELEEQLHHTHRMEAVGRLAGGVAHDFNNITQSISLSCELALQNQLAPAIESKLVDIMQQTSRAAEITRQLLAFSRRQVLQPRVVNINDCVRNALAMLTRAVGVNVSIELKLDESVDHIFIDPDQLAIVLMHLADNARAAMPHGGLLRISTAACPTSSDSQNNILSAPCAVLTVSDTGIGMDEKTLVRIFEPFFSTRETTLTTGLGLSTAHGIITQSKGRIECDSSPGHGATFRIYLPIAAAQPVNASISACDAGRARILLAEDDPVVNKHLTNSLRKAGFYVHSVGDGEEARSAFLRRRYDVVVTDILMPRLGGVELTQSLRREHPCLPVVLISGYSEEISVLQHLPRNQIAYLQKPFSIAQLVTTLRNLLAAQEVGNRRAEEMEDADKP